MAEGEITEVKPEKTPGDLKREEIAQKLGEEKSGTWERFTNYSPNDFSSRETLRNVDGWVSISRCFLNPENYSLKLSKKEEQELAKRGTITSYKWDQPAFDEDGNPIKEMEAIYIQRPPQDKTSP